MDTYLIVLIQETDFGRVHGPCGTLVLLVTMALSRDSADMEDHKEIFIIFSPSFIKLAYLIYTQKACVINYKGGGRAEIIE